MLFLQLLLVVLQSIQLMVAAVLLEQLLVGTLLQDLALGQQDNIVRMLDGGKAVGNDQHGAIFFSLPRSNVNRSRSGTLSQFVVSLIIFTVLLEQIFSVLHNH